MRNTEEKFIALHDAPHNNTCFEVIKPNWSHYISNRREASVYMSGSMQYGSWSIAESERIHAALGKAIELAKTLKLERPLKVTP